MHRRYWQRGSTLTDVPTAVILARARDMPGGCRMDRHSVKPTEVHATSLTQCGERS
jgi:hypothetical protein